MISEQLQNRINMLTGDMASQANKGAISNRDREIADMMMRPGEQMATHTMPDGTSMPGSDHAAYQDMMGIQANKGAISDREMEIYNQATGGMNPMDMVGQAKGAISNREMEIFDSTQNVSEEEVDMLLDDAAKDMTEEEKQILEDLLERGAAIQESPLAAEVQELKQYGEGPDTELAHLRPGEMVIPPEFLEDAQFESSLAKKFDEFDINPEQAIVGSGIASLNPVTGLEQFFFKKIGKALKKVVKKIAPIAGPLANFIPGVGPVLAGAIGAATNVAAGAGLKGAVSGALGGYGAGKLFSGVGSLGTVGGKTVGAGNFGGLGGLDKFRALGSGLKSGNLASTFFNPATGDKGIFGGSIGPSIRSGLGSLTGFGQTPGQQTYDTGDVIGSLDGQPVTRADLANMTPDQIGAMQMTQAAVNDKSLMQRLSAMFLPQGVEDALGTGPGGGGIFGGGQGQGGGGGLFSGGFGDALKMGGIGALAAGLGKLAYEDAKKQKGVPLTPLTTMSPTGRYNIEAEIARRMGQAAPNPVEFGLLPTGTLPELSGGKPAGMMYGGPVMAYAEGGAANSMVQQTQKIMNNLGMDVAQDTKIIKNAFGLSDPMMAANILQKTFKNKYPNLKEDDINNLINYGHEAFYREAYLAKKQAEQMNMGGIMAYAEGGAVQMQEGGEMDPSMFPRMDGDINGPGTETSDDIPAMLSDGEFVMTGQAVRGAGTYKMKSEPGGIISLVPSLEENRERGMDLMYQMMDTFASQAKVN